MRSRRSTWAILASLCAATFSTALAGTPREELLALVPPDAGITLVVEDLRTHAQEILASPLVQRLRALPTVKAWERSDKAKSLQKARAEIESALGVSAS